METRTRISEKDDILWILIELTVIGQREDVIVFALRTLLSISMESDQVSPTTLIQARATS